MFKVMIYLVPILSILIFILTIILIFSPKARGKMMSQQVKATKYMLDESKEYIKDISTNMAEATKDSIETTTRAIKKGFTENEKIYCKHCGSSIDEDSKFCKHCGKEQ